ncbi:MAG: B-box zinc finger protein [Candidatus Anstonellales archaeon]
MRCYRHQEAEAVGICVNCGKAICLDCAREKHGKLVCFRCANKVDYEGFVSDRIISKQLLEEYRKWEELHSSTTTKKEIKDGGRLDLIVLWNELSRLMRLLFPHDSSLPIMKEHGADMIMPMLLGGLVAGLLSSIPVINLLFFITLPLGSATAIAFLRMEGFFQYRISETEGAKVGILVGIAATFVSIVLLITFSTLFAESVFSFIKATKPAMKTDEIEQTMSTIGLERRLSTSIIAEKFFLNLLLYSFFGMAGGIFFADKMR